MAGAAGRPRIGNNPMKKDMNDGTILKAVLKKIYNLIVITEHLMIGS